MTRIDISKLQPQAYTAMFGLEGYLQQSTLQASLKSLVKIRASQLNHCAFCLDMHNLEARKQGEAEQRLYALAAWQESTLFTPEERAALAITEEVTLISEGGLSSETYEQGLTFFSETELAQLIMLIVTINGWNRMAVATKMIPAN